MRCSNCDAVIPAGEHHEHNGRSFCDDCYMDAMSPARFCDPWATFSARSFAARNPETALTENQQQIMRVLAETGGVDAGSLMARLKDRVAPEDGERACAALNRMGRISIENKGGKVFIRLRQGRGIPADPLDGEKTDNAH